MIVMDDVKVSKDQVLPNAKGLGGPFSCLNNVSIILCNSFVVVLDDVACLHASYRMIRSRE